MTTVTYNSKSPYYSTNQVDKWVQYLDFWTPVAIPASSADKLIENLPQKYKNRPDLLSYDMYGTAQYWWVFAVRNPDIIKDPIFDFAPGITLYAPNKDTLGTWTR